MSPITGGPFINEFHYDNAGADTGEFVEICVPSPTFDPTGFELILYNGNGGGEYDSFDLGNFPVCAGSDGKGYVVIPTPGLQNGAPDGLALVNSGGAVCEFLSYEGTFTATSGPAAGITSTNVGVAEGSTTPPGTSLQLDPATGMWQASLPETPKEVNICFLEGTRILTTEGYKNIETLTLGETIVTPSGKQLPIKWIGIQTKNPQEISDPKLSFPILIKKGAITSQVPQRDLFISPNHAVLVEELLINAGALVNQVNILQTYPTETYKYFHIELDTHELLIAEGLQSESYLPQNENRSNFDNCAEFDQHYPDGRKIILWPLDYPRISSQTKVPGYITNKILQGQKAKQTA